MFAFVIVLKCFSVKIIDSNKSLSYLSKLYKEVYLTLNKFV